MSGDFWNLALMENKMVYENIQGNTIYYFSGVIRIHEDEPIDEVQLLQFLKQGIVVDPRITKQDALILQNWLNNIFIKEHERKVVLDLYRLWNEIEKEHYKGSFFDQIQRYITNEDYCHSVFNEEIMGQIRIIRTFSLKEIFQLIEDELSSRSDLSRLFIEYVMKCVKQLGYSPVDVKNTHLKLRLIKEKIIHANNLDEIMETVWYSVSLGPMSKYRLKEELEHSLYAKKIGDHYDPKKIVRIFDDILDYNYDHIKEENIAKDCNRWRKILLLFRRMSHKKSRINRLLRLSKSLNVPKETKVLDSILDPHHTDSVLRDELKKVDIFYLVRLYNYISEMYLVGEEESTQVYVVRTGRSRVKYSWKRSEKLVGQIPLVKRLIQEEMKSRFKDHRLVIYRKKSAIQLIMPTSKRAKIGKYPNMSYINIPKVEDKVIVGISWGAGITEDAGTECLIYLYAYDAVSGTFLNGDVYESETVKTLKMMEEIGATGSATHYLSVAEKAVSFKYSVITWPFDVRDPRYEYVNMYVAKNADDIGDTVDFSNVYVSIKTSIIKDGDYCTPLHIVEDEVERVVVFCAGRIAGRVPYPTITKNTNKALMRKIKSKMTIEQFADILSIPYVTKEEDLDKLPEGIKVINLNDETLTFEKVIDLMNNNL